MTTIRMYFDGEKIGPKFERIASRQRTTVLASARGAAQDAMNEGLEAGRRNISAAGRFGPRWTRGLQGRITEGGGNIRVAIFHTISYFMVHQRGATIRAKFGRPVRGVPQLWFIDKRSARPHLVHVPQVRIPKRFRVIEVASAAMRNVGQFYNARIAKANTSG